METRIWDYYLDDLNSAIFVSVEIFTKTVEVDNNARDESHRPGFDKREQVVSLGSNNVLYNKIFIIVSCDYKIWGSCTCIQPF